VSHLEDVITVVYPAVVAGEISSVSVQVTRAEVLARLDGFWAADIIRDDRRIMVVAIADRASLKAWLSADELAELVEVSLCEAETKWNRL
jgi:hypothetical protein